MDTYSSIEHFVVRLRKGGVNLRPLTSAPWIDEIEQRLGLSFPTSFRSFIGRYAFPLLDAGKVELFANEGDGSEYDLTIAPFRDSYMSSWLMEHQLIHIGFPHIGNYDPVCFDLANQNHAEPPVIQLNHEDILLDRKTIGRKIVADNFLILIEQAHVT